MVGAPVVTIKFKAQPFCIDVHPTQPLLATGLITGQLKLFSWAPHFGQEDGTTRLCATQSW
jgi:hypothetical protein